VLPELVYGDNGEIKGLSWPVNSASALMATKGDGYEPGMELHWVS